MFRACKRRKIMSRRSTSFRRSRKKHQGLYRAPLGGLPNRSCNAWLASLFLCFPAARYVRMAKCLPRETRIELSSFSPPALLLHPLPPCALFFFSFLVLYTRAVTSSSLLSTFLHPPHRLPFSLEFLSIFRARKIKGYWRNVSYLHSVANGRTARENAGL